MQNKTILFQTQRLLIREFTLQDLKHILHNHFELKGRKRDSFVFKLKD